MVSPFACHGLPAALGEPSTSGECASAAAFPDTH